MGVLRVDHPDVEEFIRAKQNSNNLTNFNVSVAVTDGFMRAVEANEGFDLVFEGQKYRTINARNLWNEIMRSTWDWAEPGVLFIDRIQEMNNLYYCESIAATNPCAEQPLPPNGACLLGSFNLTKYVSLDTNEEFYFDMEKFVADIPVVVRSMDNIVDRALYPLSEQYGEAVSKRRMGLGVTGVANALEALGYTYGSPEFCEFLEFLLSRFTNEVYRSSALLAAEKGPFPLYNKEQYLSGIFVNDVLSDEVLHLIRQHGIRNSHLTSIAPTGTISLVADNISSGIEPVFENAVALVTEKLSAHPVPMCKHGARVLREGTGKNGAYRGWGCSLPMRQKAEQCKAIWMMLGKDGTWSFRPEDDELLVG